MSVKSAPVLGNEFQTVGADRRSNNRSKIISDPPLIHTGWLENGTSFVRRNFIKYQPIFKVISLSESGENS